MRLIQIVPKEHFRLYGALVAKEVALRGKNQGTFRRSASKQKTTRSGIINRITVGSGFNEAWAKWSLLTCRARRVTTTNGNCCTPFLALLIAILPTRVSPSTYSMNETMITPAATK